MTLPGTLQRQDPLSAPWQHAPLLTNSPGGPGLLNPTDLSPKLSLSSSPLSELGKATAPLCTSVSSAVKMGMRAPTSQRERKSFRRPGLAFSSWHEGAHMAGNLFPPARHIHKRVMTFEGTQRAAGLCFLEMRDQRPPPSQGAESGSGTGLRGDAQPGSLKKLELPPSPPPFTIFDLQAT